MKTATDTGYEKGLADGQIKTVLTILQARFGQVSELVAQSVCTISDSAMLDALAVQAAKCMTLDEFNMSIPQR